MNPISNGYQSAKANAAMLGAKLVEYAETDDMAIATVTNDSKQKFENVGEYAQYLGEKYGINQAGKSVGGVPTTINVPTHVLQQAFNDPEAREWLEENLKILQQPAKKPMFGEFVSLSYTIDSVGSITTMAVGTNDPDGSIARANAKRKQEEAREKERLEQERIEAKKEEEKRLEKLREKDEANGTIQVTISSDSAKAAQAGLANALQSGIALDVKM